MPQNVTTGAANWAYSRIASAANLRPVRLDTHQHFWRFNPAQFAEAAPALTRAADPGSVINVQLPVEENA